MTGTMSSSAYTGTASLPELVRDDLPDHVALDLTGGGFGQPVHGQHLAGALERGKALPAERDELARVHGSPGCGHHARDDLLQAFGIPVADDRAFGHAGVLEQAPLHLHGGHPDATGLDHVVGPAEAGVETVRRMGVGVAGAQPFALEHLARDRGAAPVAGGYRVTADQQVPGLAVGHRATGVV